jgi:hypothetical protein
MMHNISYHYVGLKSLSEKGLLHRGGVKAP